VPFTGRVCPPGEWLPSGVLQSTGTLTPVRPNLLSLNASLDATIHCYI